MTVTAERSEYHDAPPLSHDLAYHLEGDTPVLD
jgi:hypothetical protein